MSAPPDPFGRPPSPAALPSAAYGQRAAAAVIDFALKAVFAILILIAVGSITGIGFLAGDETSGYIAIGIAVLMGFATFAVVSLLYEPVYMVTTNGRTLGKQLMGCRVACDDGRPMTFATAFLREVLIKWLAFGVIGNAVTAGMPFATLLDNLWPLWDPQQRALHDLAADTRVVRD